jgi:hypothetical protein
MQRGAFVLASCRLFKEVDRNLAVLVVIFGDVMPAVIDFISVVERCCRPRRYWRLTTTALGVTTL